LRGLNDKNTENINMPHIKKRNTLNNDKNKIDGNAANKDL